MSCAELLNKHASAWQAATSHQFLEETRDGIIGENQFDTWLVQDYQFVLRFVSFAGSLLSKALQYPGHLEALCGGIGALQDELRWFKATARERGLCLDVAPVTACQRYCQSMANFAAQPYAVQAVTFWAIERAYNEAWGMHCPKQEPYRTYALRWGSKEFGKYVEQLQAQADEALAAAPQGQREEAEVAFIKVCELERDFWDMAYSSTAFE